MKNGSEGGRLIMGRGGLVTRMKKTTITAKITKGWVLTSAMTAKRQVADLSRLTRKSTTDIYMIKKI
ncbi:hypothetical protein FOPG_20076 [Fusarium oxysporum f. sp. conglutinans race 2 54008]|uniref:Uncharacterized protein n=1 Tax=Fusarium oxysporum f. sp. conglutinans race 2 54008 TaxID=1089457 RepID=X0GJ19_FUSOX|nr:hypothetical protein FOPG_20076 [Fusarium oxysporum f. sp. conglutinans race 2 54008]